MSENYILMFRDEGIDWTQYQDDERGKAFYQKFVDWTADLDKRGKLYGVEALARGGKTVRRKGASIVVDGPYAEGREAVLGYFIVTVANLDEALALAAESPHANAGGATEVRLVTPFPKPGNVGGECARPG